MDALRDIGGMVSCTPGVKGGVPCLAGTRFPVISLAALVKQGYSVGDIKDSYEFLTDCEIHAGLAFYFANQEAFDRQLGIDEAEDAEESAWALREGFGPPDYTSDEREAGARELEQAAAVLRSRLV